MKKSLLLFCLFFCLLSSCKQQDGNDEYWQMKGVVLSVEDLGSLNWPKLAAKNGINTIGTHIFPKQVLNFIKTEKGKTFLQNCEKYGIQVEHQLHSIGDLLPRELFEENPEMFRMNERGERDSDCNCCVHSEEALNIIAENAVKYAKELSPTNHRYYFWLDDGKPTCLCPLCKDYTASEQALIIENRIIKALKEIDPEAQLAHLAYHNTLEAPCKVKPEKSIFLEFAPFFRRWDKPLSDGGAVCQRDENRSMTHADNLRLLKENLEVFPAETAVILEYWLDVSLCSRWKKPAVKLPWHKDVFIKDIDTYANMGIKNVTTFAVYMDTDYFKTYPDKTCLKEYGEGLSSYRPVK